MRSHLELYRLILVGFLILLSLCLVLYFSLRPSPALSEIVWLPRWLAVWADRHGDLRTGVPYLGMSLLISLCITLYDQALPSVLVPSSARRIAFLVFSCGTLFALLVLTEIVQYWMPQRWARWQDVFWGGTGILVGIFIWSAAEWLWCLFTRWIRSVVDRR
jgi:VanZ family protein